MDSILGFGGISTFGLKQSSKITWLFAKTYEASCLYPEAFLTPVLSPCLLCEVCTFPQECCEGCAFSPSCSLLSYCYCKFQQNITWHVELCHVCSAWCLAKKMEVIFLDCLLRSPLMTENLNAASYRGAKGRINPGQAAASSQCWHRELDNNTNTHINRQSSVTSSPDLHLFGLWEELGTPGEKPHRHRKKVSVNTDFEIQNILR